MGVVYKLIPEISSFIIEQKRSNARVSCQDLAELVYSHFGQRISKSSVHELLKTAQVIHPRTRSLKQKFQIPTEKKAQLFGQGLSSPKVDQPMSSPNVLIGDTEHAKELDARQKHSGMTIEGMGEIFLKAAFYDLSFRPILGLQDYEDIGSLGQVGARHAVPLQMDWGYLTTSVESFKVELEDGHGFYIDARWQGLYEENPHEQSLAAPVERAIAQMSDCLFNNIKPIIIRNVGARHAVPLLQDFISSFENLPGKTIKKISLAAANPADGGANGQILTEFNQPLKMRRYFVVGVVASVEDFFQVGAEHARPVQVLKKDDKNIITNLNPDSCDVWGMYLDRHSQSLSFPNVDTMSPPNVSIGGPGLQELDSRLKHSGMTSDGEWLKTRLKERALMFFPSEMPPAALEEILALSGFVGATALPARLGEPSARRAGRQDAVPLHEIYLQIPPGFPYLAHVQKAAARLNNLDIANNKREKLRICIE